MTHPYLPPPPLSLCEDAQQPTFSFQLDQWQPNQLVFGGLEISSLQTNMLTQLILLLGAQQQKYVL